MCPLPFPCHEGEKDLITDGGRPRGDAFLDGMFSILASARRRRIIRHLQDADGLVGLADLASTIASTDAEKYGVEIDVGARRVRDSLYHVHVPKLESMDIVAFDQDRNVIEASENFPVIVSYLEKW